jgi:hypothetical protein
MHLKVKRICYWMIKWVIRQWLAVPYICYCRQIVWQAWWGQGNILILIRHPHRQDASQQNLRLIRTWGIGNNLRLGWRKCALLSGRYAHPIVQPSMLCPSDWARDWRSRGWVTVTFSQHTLRRERFLRPTVLCRRSLTRRTGHELWPTSQRPYDMMNSVSSIEEVLHDTRQIILFNTNSSLFYLYIIFSAPWLAGCLDWLNYPCFFPFHETRQTIKCSFLLFIWLQIVISAITDKMVIFLVWNLIFEFVQTAVFGWTTVVLVQISNFEETKTS